MILINKTDLVTDAELRETEARIRGINPYAKLHRTQRAQIPLNEVLDRKAFDLERILDIEPANLEVDDHAHGHDHDHHHDHGHDHGHSHSHGGLKHYHDEEMQSISMSTDQPLDPDKFFPFIQNLTQAEGPNILRCKGIVSLKDDPQRFVFQGVHMMLDGDRRARMAGRREAHQPRGVHGRNLPEEKVRKGFESTIAAF